MTDKKLIGYIDLTPSPTSYRMMLRTIIDYSTNTENVEWAKGELERVADVSQWSGKVNAPNLKIVKDD